MGDPIAPKEGGANALEVMFAISESGGSTPDAHYIKGGRPETIDGESAAPIAVESIWTDSTPSSTHVDVSTNTQILAANPNRQFAILTNDGTQVVYLGLADPATTHNGYRMEPGGTFVISNIIPWTGVVYGIASSGTQVICVMEV
jgi:hypothetical protein